MDSTFTLVPQQIYRAQKQYAPLYPIYFTTAGRPGVNLEDARIGRLMGLDDRTTTPTVSVTSNRITLRIIWPGVNTWAFQNLSVYDHTYDANAYTKEQLAETIARHIWKFFEEMLPAGGGSDPVWALTRIDFRRLYLTELRHVAAGSWQPVLHYRW